MFPIHGKHNTPDYQPISGFIRVTRIRLHFLANCSQVAELKIFLKTFCGLSWAQLGQCEWVVRGEGEKYLYYYKQPPV